METFKIICKDDLLELREPVPIYAQYQKRARLSTSQRAKKVKSRKAARKARKRRK